MGDQKTTQIKPYMPDEGPYPSSCIDKTLQDKYDRLSLEVGPTIHSRLESMCNYELTPFGFTSAPKGFYSVSILSSIHIRPARKPAFTKPRLF